MTNTNERDRVTPRRTWAERLAVAQAFYSEERARGKCKVCGRSGYLKAGPHPSGLRGQPVKLCGPDLEKLRAWIAEAGWVCQRCCQTTGGGGGGHERSPRGELASIRKRLKPLRDRKQTPESCREYQEQNRVRMSVEAFRDWQEEATKAGRWMDPEEFRGLIIREVELQALINRIALT